MTLHYAQEGFVTRKSITLNSCQKSIVDLFWYQVETRPHHIAAAQKDRKITYYELARESLYIANYFHNYLKAKNTCIGLFLNPTIELIFSTWGILLSGNAYLPLSNEYPLERIKYMIQDSEAQFVITQEELKEQLIQSGLEKHKLITLSEIKKFSSADIRVNSSALQYQINPSDLAYVIYTSGSTGKPKGVMIEHHSILNQMNWLNDVFEVNEQATILQKTLISFDAAQWEILALCCGTKVIIANASAYKNPNLLIDLINQEGVTILQCVPALWQALLYTNRLHECATLKKIFSGGEALHKNLAIKLNTTLPHCNIINLYGPTECTINSSAFVVDTLVISNYPNTISIGTPIKNMQYYIFNNHRLVTTLGEIGELYISGDGLGRGYINNAKASAEKFVFLPFNEQLTRLYKTGDLVYWNEDGTIHYVGRSDNQVKLRGYRIELDEIKSAIETHDWIKHAAVILKEDLNKDLQNLIAFIELNPSEAALMDQGNHDAHHQTKESKAQVAMQLSNKGCRDADQLIGKNCIELPGKTANSQQIEMVFARKTYRFFEGSSLRKKDIDNLLCLTSSFSRPNKIEFLSFNELGEILRFFGQFISKERLLPKFGYASPGALYATQMYLELHNIEDLKAGYYYYHPIFHQLILIQKTSYSNKKAVKIHFIGKKSGIESIYKNNVQEVLEIEVGHMVGLFEKLLPNYGFKICEDIFNPAVKDKLEVGEEDYYLGSFQLDSGKRKAIKEHIEIYVQIHPGKMVDVEAGLYQYKRQELKKISNEIVLKKHVIAINQEVYNRASFGITIISTTKKKWLAYINLGRKLQTLQMNSFNIGLMSAGYSSKTGNDLPSAKRIKEILGKDNGPSYFFIGGKISEEQKLSQDMKEDSVHMKGPAEMIKDDLKNFLPDYMIPNKVIIIDEMPLTVNGKIDFKELKQIKIDIYPREYIAPRNEIEEKLCNIWQHMMNINKISMIDNFFELGGNSLIALNLINKINIELATSLPLQVLFEYPTIEKLAVKIAFQGSISSPRLISLQHKGSKKPIYCWPGLGGYCMNLRLLAKSLGEEQPFYGVQAYGINLGENPYKTIKEMARHDIQVIKEIQPKGPYRLWGYSFGARVAFEAAYQLEQMHENVEHLFLLAPGIPKITELTTANNYQISYSNPHYVTILFSIFMKNIASPELIECLNEVHDEYSFIRFIVRKNSYLSEDLVKRILNIVSQVFEFKYPFNELRERKLKTRISVFKAKGDEYSFLENKSSKTNYNVIEFDFDHYQILKDPGINKLIQKIYSQLS